ncbi:hypothetical protein AMAG_15504 [Allomyces macrogynus ATCC 38327]|uniref:Uncharacterized protein n=1 Tax=Allomyces macrogynus (strain ATCC 38327) TaxID=578462 RepID=A0A0L0T936_ALLM3|nr:hypothetical protein AMAG_15504 [Allomyces macrogynus ATCC 38327]|eukprot:KNE71262.1 hypothetical protein AMAG_15504 [Allomyces macrogynus ATCC 38327]
MQPPRRLVSPTTNERVCRGILGREIVWTAAHPHLEDLEPLRALGDDLADNALDALLAARTSSAAPACMHDLATALRDAVTALDEGDTASPYTHLSPSHQASIRAMWAHITTVPDWVDWALVDAGQSFLWQHLGYVSWVLSMGTLLGGYSAASIVAVLDATGYLSGRGEGERVVTRRLLETSHMLVHAMMSPEAVKPGGTGWKSVVNVRFLHALVRRRVLAQSKTPGRYSVAQHGLPVNQEDMVVTALGFAVVMLAGIERLGVTTGVLDPTATIDPDLAYGVAGYMHVWAYISHLSGIRADLNPLLPPAAARDAAECAIAAGLVGAGVLVPRADSDELPFAHATRATEATFVHLYAPDTTSRLLAAALIDGFSKVPPTYTPRATCIAAARIILGDRIADELGVPATTEKEVAKAWRVVRFSFRPFAMIWRYVPWLRPVLKRRLVAMHEKVFVEHVLRPAVGKRVSAAVKSDAFAFHTDVVSTDAVAGRGAKVNQASEVKSVELYVLRSHIILTLFMAVLGLLVAVQTGTLMWV